MEDGLAQASVAISGARQAYEDLYRTLYGRILPAFAQKVWSDLTDRSIRQEPEDLPPEFDEAVEEFMRKAGGQLITNVTANQRRRIMAIIRSMVRDGKSFFEIVNELEERVPAISRTKGRRIARTETVRASNAGAEAGARATGLDLEKTWLATLDHRVRDSHASADGQTVPQSENFTVGGFEAPYPAAASLPPRESVMCFPGDEVAKIDPDTLRRCFRSVYHGEIVTVKTASGEQFSATPNHPILTRDGWVAAGSLNKGQGLVKRTSLERGVGKADVEYVPSTFEEIHQSLSKAGVNVRVGRRVVNFYGDRPDSDVDVVTAARLLHNRSDPLSGKVAGGLPFVSTDLTKRSLLGNGRGSLDGLPVGIGHVSHRPVGRFGVLLVLLIGALRHHQAVRLGLGPWFISGLVESAVNDRSSYAEIVCDCIDGLPRLVAGNDLLGRYVQAVMFAARSDRNIVGVQDATDGADTATEMVSDLLDGSSGSVATDDVIGVEVNSGGHGGVEVYTLETEDGWYGVSDYVARNCRCVATYNTT